MMEVVMTNFTGAIRRTNLQSNRHHQYTNTQHCRPTNSVRSLSGGLLFHPVTPNDFCPNRIYVRAKSCFSLVV